MSPALAVVSGELRRDEHPLSPPPPPTRRPPQSLPLSPERLIVCPRSAPVYDPFGQCCTAHLVARDEQMYPRETMLAGIPVADRHSLDLAGKLRDPGFDTMAAGPTLPRG